MDRSGKICRQRADQPFGANVPIELKFVIGPMVFYLLNLTGML